MTDTAQPMPDDDDEGSLTPEMQQRAAALGIARNVLKTSAVFGQSGVQSWTVQDLLTVADYILGTDKDLPVSMVAEEGTEVSPGLEYVTTFKPSALDDDTATLPDYPEDALPR